MVVPRGLNGATVVNADLETGISVSQAKQGPQEIASLPLRDDRPDSSVGWP